MAAAPSVGPSKMTYGAGLRRWPDGTVGLAHREVEASGLRCHVATQDMRGASNGRASGEDDGYLKLVFDAINERLLGVLTKGTYDLPRLHDVDS